MADFDLVPVDDDPFAPMSRGEFEAGRAKLYTPASLAESRAEGIDRVFENFQRKIMGVGAALAAPGNVLGGKYSLAQYPGGRVAMEPAFYEEGAALAGLLPIGGVAMPKPRGSLGVFGGKLAATADLDKMNAAKLMSESGAMPREIWQKTGWFKGPDREWRFEIPDEASVFSPEQFAGKLNEFDRARQVYDAKVMMRHNWMNVKAQELGFENVGRMPMGQLVTLSREADVKFPEASVQVLRPPESPLLPDVLEHPELFAAYPHLRDVQMIREMDEKNFGSFFPGGGKVSLRTQPSAWLTEGGHKLDPHSTLLHEIQHSIQEREGWLGKGANPSSPGMAEVGQRVIGRIDAKLNKLDEQRAEWYRGLGDYKYDLTPEQLRARFAVAKPDVAKEMARLMEQKLEASFDPAYAAYTREVGEVEARNVQKRFRDPLIGGFRGTELGAPHPMMTQDFPYSEQVIFEKKKNPLMQSRGK